MMNVDDNGILGNKKEISVYEKEIWNAAIEKAAYWLETANRNDTDDAKEIRKLKV